MLMSMFSDTVLPNITWSGSTVAQNCTQAISASVTAKWESDGSCTGTGCSANPMDIIDWLDRVAGGNGDDFKIKWVLDSGDIPTAAGWSTQSTWYVLDSNRQLGHSLIDSGIKSSTITITIREGDEAATEISRVVTLYAEVT